MVASPRCMMYKEGFILPIHHDCGSFVVNGSGYDERKNLPWAGAMNPSAIPRHKTGRWLRAAIANNSNARQALPDLQIRACAEEIVYAELVYA